MKEKRMMNGWVAELDEAEDRTLWIAVLYYGGSFCTHLDGVWFTSKEHCEEFICTEVIGAKLMSDTREEE